MFCLTVALWMADYYVDQLYIKWVKKSSVGCIIKLCSMDKHHKLRHYKACNDAFPDELLHTLSSIFATASSFTTLWSSQPLLWSICFDVLFKQSYDNHSRLGEWYGVMNVFHVSGMQFYGGCVPLSVILFTYQCLCIFDYCWPVISYSIHSIFTYLIYAFKIKLVFH